MKDYKEFQFGWVTFIILIPIQIFVAYLYFNELGDRPLDKNTFLFVNGTFFLVYCLFYGMTIKVDTEKIDISFGPGVIRKRISVGKIKNIDTIKNPWYYGWGIRLIPNGWLYNVSGSDGIELRFNDNKRVIRIGTKDSTKLKDEIIKRLKK
jgi:hypothetical protein